MPSTFLPRLVNDPFADPGVFVSWSHARRALLFDIGDTGGLSGRDVLKIAHVFVSHTHMDHFCGFDRLLRSVLGRDKDIHFFGPRGFFANIEGKLAGYTWNLVDHYPQSLTLRVTEIHEDRMLTRGYRCRDGFAAAGPETVGAFNGELVRENAFTVKAVILDHGIPCLGFCLAERYHVNIIKERLDALGLTVGPWLNRFKAALYAGQAPGTAFDPGTGQVFELGRLADQIARIAPGQKIAYITDVAFTPENIARIVDLAADCDQLFVEAAFLDEDRDIALKKKHLTAAQAGQLAALARASRFTLFHFSPRYSGQAARFQAEARDAYRRTQEQGNDG